MTSQEISEIAYNYRNGQHSEANQQLSELYTDSQLDIFDIRNQLLEILSVSEVLGLYTYSLDASFEKINTNN